MVIERVNGEFPFGLSQFASINIGKTKLINNQRGYFAKC
jgi:hypothetical protein